MSDRSSLAACRRIARRLLPTLAAYKHLLKCMLISSVVDVSRRVLEFRVLLTYSDPLDRFADEAGSLLKCDAAVSTTQAHFNSRSLIAIYPML